MSWPTIDRSFGRIGRGLPGASVGGPLPYIVEENATGPALDQALALRSRVFRNGQSDRDRHDGNFSHLVVRSGGTGPACGTFRYRVTDGAGAGTGYAARFYDLTKPFAGIASVVEVGRLCLAPDCARADVLRILFAALARLSVRARADLVFGCASFPGAAVAPHQSALAALVRDHCLPAPLRVRAHAPVQPVPDGPAAPPGALPPLLRAYLAMGAGVGPDAVLDPALDTLHVFAALDPRAVPPARARSLLALAARL